MWPLFSDFRCYPSRCFCQLFSGLDSIDGQWWRWCSVPLQQAQDHHEIYLPALIPFCVHGECGHLLRLEGSDFAEFMGSTTGVGFALSTANSNLQTEGVFLGVSTDCGDARV